jgi:hypothetical protein
LTSFGITEENMQTISAIWTARYPNLTPNITMRDEFVGVLRDGLLKLVAEAANDPTVVFQKQVDSMVTSLRTELDNALKEPIPEGADRATV